MVTLTDPICHPRPTARPAVGVLGDDLAARRVEAVLRGFCRVVARGQTVDALLDAERIPFEVAVLAGGAELLARGGALELLGNLRPACPIVVVAMSEELGLIRKALRVGAHGFVFHSSLEHGLGPAIDTVRAGHLSVPRAIRRRISWSSFSVRERQVLQLAADGLTNSEIADRLYLSESTIKCHLSSGFRKLGVCSRAEAAAAVLDPHSGLMVSMAGRVPPTSARPLVGVCA